MATEEKLCQKCFKIKDVSGFYLGRNGQRSYRYGSCKECRIKKDLRRYYKNRKKLIRYQREYRSRPEIKKQRSSAARERNQRLRMAVLLHYSGGSLQCACCSEDNIRFLTVDHSNGGGNKHRKEIGRGNIYYWIIKNNFPDGFGILCFNCNMGRSQNDGVCPHKNGN